MPITAFSNFTDGLDPNRRSREHFIANTNLDDDALWVPLQMVSGSSPAALTSRLEDSLLF
jgi:hypothetical protein